MIILVGVVLSAVLLVLGLFLIQVIGDAARVYVNGQTVAVASSTAQAVQAAIQGDVALAQTIAAQKARLDADRQKNDELVAANSQLEILATTDSLTGLPNRVVLYDRLEVALRLARRSGGVVSLLLLDLDRFKEINDTLGHDCGDQILCAVGERLAAALRASDTVARLGGDEFAVMLPECDIAAADVVAGAITQAMGARFEIGGVSLDVGLSIGIATYPAHGDDAATLMRQADVAMYVAKKSHSGSAVYVAADDTHSPRRLVLMSELRLAIERGELALYYQPQINMTTGAVVGVEALVRWPQPGGGIIMPDQFIQLAEHTGLIGPLTDWVLAAAIGQLSHWQRDGLRLGVSVNLSACTLHDHSLPAKVSALLHSHAVEPGLLTLEITESAVMADTKRAHDVITLLGDSGVRVAIDDFGTGYSSLGYLKRLPVHEIKLDKSFVLGLGTHSDERDEAIVRSVIAMAHALDREVVAESVEHQQAMYTLRRLGCTVAQGYYFSRPMPSASVLEWVASHDADSCRLSSLSVVGAGNG